MRKLIEKTILKQKGIIFAKPTYVYRNSYTGRGILADNAWFNSRCKDLRGYLPVERWILSLTEAENPIPMEGEGITKLILTSGEAIRLDDALASSEELLFGPYLPQWPLIKLLDIGGEEVMPDYTGEPEVPPIPVHVHGGKIVNGKVRGPGKLEAYFFPPTDMPPYDLRLGYVKTRLGLKPETTASEFLEALEQFGLSDRMYSLLNEYPINPYDSWMVYPGIVHAPGPWVTLEIQTPQDDFNFTAWRLGGRLKADFRSREFESLALRGLQSTQQLLSEVVNWKLSTIKDFKERFYRQAQVIEEGSWGRKLRIFFAKFFGEAIEIEPGYEWRQKKTESPLAVLLWTGNGTANNQIISIEMQDRKEFLLAPDNDLAIRNTGSQRLTAFILYPMNSDFTII